MLARRLLYYICIIITFDNKYASKIPRLPLRLLPEPFDMPLKKNISFFCFFLAICFTFVVTTKNIP